MSSWRSITSTAITGSASTAEIVAMNTASSALSVSAAAGTMATSSKRKSSSTPRLVQCDQNGNEENSEPLLVHRNGQVVNTLHSSITSHNHNHSPPSRPWFRSVLCLGDTLRYVSRKSVARCIAEGDEKALVDALQVSSRTADRHGGSGGSRSNNVQHTVTMKRKVSKNIRTTTTRGSASSSPEVCHTFTQECDFVIYAVDCGQWHLLPVLNSMGYSLNKPLFCRRWTTLCPPITHRPNAPPYKSMWTRGRYTYQSALDYYIASVYETLGEDYLPARNESEPHGGLGSPLASAFLQMDHMIRISGVDVHRIDSVIVLNLLASSYDRYLLNFHDDRLPIEDIPMTSDGYWEMKALRCLISHGFSQFECFEFLSPCHHWFGLLLCLLCHPKLLQFHEPSASEPEENSSSSCASTPTPRLPPIIREAALLLINLISLRCLQPLQRPRYCSWYGPAASSFSTPASTASNNSPDSSSPHPYELTTNDPGDHLDSLGHLKLRKAYVKRYAEHRTSFHSRLLRLRSLCFEKHLQPLSLRFLCRNKIRSQLTGVHFQRRLSELNLPEEVCKFLAYIEPHHLKNHESVGVLLSFSHGLVDLDFYQVPTTASTNTNSSTNSPTGPPTT